MLLEVGGKNPNSWQSSELAISKKEEGQRCRGIFNRSVAWKCVHILWHEKWLWNSMYSSKFIKQKILNNHV